jgi:hypothetical protein
MAPTVINASHWASQQTTQYTKFFTGHNVSEADSPTCYHPFAWISINHITHQMTAARDHFGQEPFYYTRHGNRFIFGSTLADVIKYLPKIPEISQHCIIDCFTGSEFITPPYSDETYYSNIFRLTPGHLLRINDQDEKKESFWQLHQKKTLYYANEQDYLAHFSVLMDEAVRHSTQNKQTLAAEFSGGVDSSAIFIACHNAQIQPRLFTHIPPIGREPTAEDHNVKTILEQFNAAHRHCAIDAQYFEPIAIFQQFAMPFAGAPPYLLGLLGTNLHQAIIDEGHTTLISGLGGDDCVSLLFPKQMMYHQRLQDDGFFSLFKDWLYLVKQEKLGPEYRLWSFLQLLSHYHPITHHLFYSVRRLIHRLLQHQSILTEQTQPFYKTLREYEYAILQGNDCHEIRMRVEYDAIIGKSLGFTYVYPLLYPPLVEFCFSLPLSQKFKHGTMRGLMRDYINQHIQGFQHSTKGGAAVPSTMQKCRDADKLGMFDAHFNDLPFKQYISQADRIDEKLLRKIRAYMIKFYHDNA